MKPGNRKSSFGSDAGGRPAEQSDAEDNPKNNRQLDGFLKNMFQATRQQVNSATEQRRDPMVRICRRSKDCGEEWPTPLPASTQEESDYVPKGADRCSCSRKRFDGVCVPEGAGH